MGVHALREISQWNYDSALGALLCGRYHNSWGIFLIVHTCPCINNSITRGNHKMNADRDADGLFSSALPLTRSDRALSRSLSTTYEMGKLWDKHRRPAHHHTPMDHTSHGVFYLWASRPCYERHAPVTSVTTRLPCGCTKYHVRGAFHLLASRVIKFVRVELALISCS